jgi:hypothetical protein
MKVLLIGALVFSLQSSVCTGGMFAVTAALAGHIGTTGTTGGLFSPDTLLCQLFTPVAEESAGSIDRAAHASGCQDSDFCLQNAARTAREDMAMIAAGTVLHDEITTAIPVGFSVTDLDSPPPSSVARAGPPFEHAALLAHMLVKRE